MRSFFTFLNLCPPSISQWFRLYSFSHSTGWYRFDKLVFSLPLIPSCSGSQASLTCSLSSFIVQAKTRTSRDVIFVTSNACVLFLAIIFFWQWWIARKISVFVDRHGLISLIGFPSIPAPTPWSVLEPSATWFYARASIFHALWIYIFYWSCILEPERL